MPVACRLAVNTVDFFNAISILYGTLSEFCTAESCPVMCAGPKYEYRWADGVKVKKPIECSAPDYVLYLMEWVESQLDDPKARREGCLAPCLCERACGAAPWSHTAGPPRRCSRWEGSLSLWTS